MRSLLLMVVLAACGSTTHPKAEVTEDPVETLAFTRHDANTWNYFLRRGPVAAHLLATSGMKPRILVAFPAGDEGIGMWFETADTPTVFALDGGLAPVERADGMRGVRAVVRSSRPQLRATGIVMSSVRVLREYTRDPKRLPAAISNRTDAGRELVIRRTTLDGHHHLELRVEPRGGATAVIDASGALVVVGPEPLEVALTFLQDDAPLAPIPLDELLAPGAAPSPADREALAFLAYREKLLAGSWRFLTYFGRDTLISVRLLMPVLRPAAIEGALGAVLDRLDATGDVAHEEAIGEFAALESLRAGRGAVTEPILDHEMVDDDFLLAPVVAHYLLETTDGKARARAFVARYGPALVKNLELVIDRARAFGASPIAANLIALRSGSSAGNWRDSSDGLGGGRYPYDVNTALVPAALDAAARLFASGIVCECGDRAAFAVGLAEVWRAKAPQLFEIELAADDAQARLDRYAAEQGVPRVVLDGPFAFSALSLDADGRPIPVMSSDDGFALLFGAPPPAAVSRIAREVARPFPAGLMTPVGMVIANPAFAGDGALRARFARDRYHGAVIWSWQQAMMAAGLARQLERADLPRSVRDELVAAQDALWAAIHASDAVRVAEHWSWRYTDGAYVIDRFGEGGDDESNAVQLWSTVYLAVQPPSAARAAR